MVNKGSQTCVRDLSGSIQVYTLYSSDNQRLWSTADCFPGTGTEVRQLTPGESVEYKIRWGGKTSQPQCAGQREGVGPGSYQAVAELGGLKAEPATLTLTE